VFFSTMSTVKEIERAVEQLPAGDFAQLADWIRARRRSQLLRGHGAFLNSYAPQDESLVLEW
jgi:hypothetical protein